MQTNATTKRIPRTWKAVPAEVRTQIYDALLDEIGRSMVRSKVADAEGREQERRLMVGLNLAIDELRRK